MDNPTTGKLPPITLAEVKKLIAEQSVLNHEDIKKAIKEAIKEWLTEVNALVGKWTIRSVLAALVAWIGYLYLTGHGWIAPGVKP